MSVVSLFAANDSIHCLTILHPRAVRIAAYAVVVAQLAIIDFALSKTIPVGPTEVVKTIAQAVHLAQDDDIIEVASGNYFGDVAVWKQNRLTIRGVGMRPVVVANGKDAQGKAIWVLQKGDFTIENLEFRGARVADGNGAAIRLQGGRLRVVNCAFFDNQMGILTHDGPTTQLIIETSEFGQAPAQDAPLPHLLYAGKIDLLRVVGSHFHGGYRGHLLKSRARVSDIRYSFLVDGPGGKASYEAEFPNGGDVTLVGNVVGQSITTENPTVIAYGAEGPPWPINRLRMVHNTLYSEGLRPAWFLHLFREHFRTAPEVMTRNNLIIGAGAFTLGIDGQHDGNFFAPATVLGDPGALDFSIARDSWLRGMVHALPDDPDHLRPRLEQRSPGQLTPIAVRATWVPGAVQATTLDKP